MNKKILSFVLAMVLGVCCGVANASYDGEDMIGASVGSGGYTVNMSSSSSMSGIPADLQGSVKTIFKYVGGIMVGNANANGSFDVLRNGQNFMSFKLNEDENGKPTGGYTLANITADADVLKSLGFDVSDFYGSDGELKSGKSENDVLKALAKALKNFGVTESDLKALVTDSDGNATGSTPEAAKWFGKNGNAKSPLSELLKGSNNSIQINFVAEGGPTCTVITNGQPSYTMNSNGQVIADYHYTEPDANGENGGFLDYVDELTFEVDETNTDTSKTKYKASRQRTYYNDFGNAEKTVQLTKGNDGKWKEESTIKTYEYSNPNGSGYLVSTTDKNNNTTHYRADGKVDHTTNGKDGTSSIYHYRDNGTIMSVEAKGKNGVTTATTIYSRAEQNLGTTTKSIPGSYSDPADYFYAMVKEAKSKGNDKEAVYNVLDKYGFTGKGSISIFDYMLNDSSYNTMFAVAGVTQSHLNQMRTLSNGYSAVGSISNLAEGSAKNTQMTTKKDTKTLGGSFSAYDVSSTSTTDKGKAYTSTITVNNKGAAYVQYEGYCEIRAAKATVTTTHYKDPAVEGEMWSPEDEEISDEELEQAIKDGIIEDDDRDAKEKKKELALKKKAKELGIIENYEDYDNLSDEAKDDLEKGFFTKDGKTYAIVKANSINILDGSGFQAADGEMVLVEVNEETKNTIKGSDDKRIMFMGDVRESAAGGYLTMSILNEEDGSILYGTGFKQGDDVQAEKDKIFLISLQTSIQNGMDITEASKALEAYNEQNGTNFTTADAEDAVANMSSADQWIVDNTKGNMQFFKNERKNYKAGWDELVQAIF